MRGRRRRRERRGSRGRRVQRGRRGRRERMKDRKGGVEMEEERPQKGNRSQPLMGREERKR
jgi:hypothetical protein